MLVGLPNPETYDEADTTHDMNKIPLVDLSAQYQSIKPAIDKALHRVLDNNSFILGKEVSNFEAAFADYIGTRNAVGVASGTAALHLALLAYDIGPGDEVITVAHTFFATAEAISVTGATPVFVDIEEHSQLMDLAAVEAAITPRTRAVIAVHLYGRPVDMPTLKAICDKHGLRLIEDAAQAHGAEIGGRRCGNWGDLGCFSFFPGKNLGCYGDGGMVTGNDEKILDRVARLRNHGRSTKYEHEEIGWGYRLDALQAAVLNVKLEHLDAWTEARRSHAQRYNELLQGLDLSLPADFDEGRHVYHLYVIRSNRRDQLLKHLHQSNIGAGIHYPTPMHRQPAYQTSHGHLQLPSTERVASQVLSLPLYPELNEQQIQFIAQNLKEAMA